MVEQKDSPAKQLYYQATQRLGKKGLEELTLLLEGLTLDTQEEARQKAEIRPITEEDIERAKEITKNFGLPVGLKSGFWEIDNMTAGFAPGELTVIGAGTSQGKSLVSANLFAQQAMDGHKVVYVTLETLADNFNARLIQIMGEEEVRWAAESKLLFIQKEERIDWQSIKFLVEQAVKRYQAEIVYIDHLHYFAQGADDDPATLGAITQECCDAAKKYRVPIVLMSQLNRNAPRGERPRVYDLKGSSYIEQNADIIMGVWQNLEKTLDPHVWVGLEKNRNRSIWRPEVAETFFRRDGLKMLPNLYDFEKDAEFNITKRFQDKYDKAKQMNLV